LRDAERRQDGGHRMLGPADRRRAVSGLRRELRPPRLPGAVVPAVRSLHVPVPRRRLLPRWFSRLRTAGARIVRIPNQNRERRHHDSRWRAPYSRAECGTRHTQAAMRVIAAIGNWLDHRLQLAAPIRDAAEHPVPRNTASWWDVFGSAALVVFCLQLATGILLAMVYVPSADEAWSSLQALNHQVAFGWFVRALHGWGSNFMGAIVLIHMAQVFLFGAYKYPRELTWIVGVFLLLTTLGMAFTGQIMRFDQDAYWGLGIGASIASRVPVVGPAIVSLMLGGPIIAGATLSRFFTLHVFVVPGTLIALVCLHLLMVLKLGINEWPMPGRLVRRATYEHDYHELTRTDGAPFVPYAVWKDMFFAAFILLAVGACAWYFGPFGPTGRPDPRIIQTVPKPDYFFLWLYALLSLLPPSLETPALLIGPVVAIVVLLVLPFLSGEGEKSWKRRPIAVLTVMLIAMTLGTFTHLATYAPGSPPMNRWSGARVHALGDSGGEPGPSLDGVAVRLTQDQLIRQVIQGGGNMPAYGKNLSPAETTALVAFLQKLRPPGHAPA